MDIRTISRVVGAVSLIGGSLAVAVPIGITDADAPIAAQLQDYAQHSALAMLSPRPLSPALDRPRGRAAPGADREDRAQQRVEHLRQAARRRPGGGRGASA